MIDGRTKKELGTPKTKEVLICRAAPIFPWASILRLLLGACKGLEAKKETYQMDMIVLSLSV